MHNDSLWFPESDSQVGGNAIEPSTAVGLWLPLPAGRQGKMCFPEAVATDC